MSTRATDAYTETSIETQDQGKLVVMLYEGAIKYLRIAKRELENEDYAKKGEYINKAQDIISELDNSLDMAVGGDLAQNLRALYGFMYGTLSEANAGRDADKIQECIDLLEELHGAWEQAARETANDRVDIGSESDEHNFSV
jgi:flagellar protein FliS